MRCMPRLLDRFYAVLGRSLQWRVPLRRWTGSQKFLVIGELIAAAAGVVVAVLTFVGGEVVLGIIASVGAVSAFMLFAYAVDLSAKGEMPLTPGMASRIRAVIEIKDMECRGAEVDWSSINQTGTVRLNFLKAVPELAAWFLAVSIQQQADSPIPLDEARQVAQEALDADPALLERLQEEGYVTFDPGIIDDGEDGSRGN